MKNKPTQKELSAKAKKKIFNKDVDFDEKTRLKWAKYLEVKQSPFNLSTITDEDFGRNTTVDIIMNKLDEWSKKDTSLIFFDFLDTYSIPESTYYFNLRKNKKLEAAHKRALGRLGSRRQKLAMFKEFECNEKPLMSTMRFYSREHRECYDEEVNVRRQIMEKNEADEKVKIIELSNILSEAKKNG